MSTDELLREKPQDIRNHHRAQKKRQDYEAQAIQPFCDVLSQHGLKWNSGQKADNRIILARNISYQFGDLRFSEGGRHLVVEVESAGGVTNLVKYWYCLREGLLRASCSSFTSFGRLRKIRTVPTLWCGIFFAPKWKRSFLSDSVRGDTRIYLRPML